MEKLTIYEKPTCTTCRSVAKILFDLGISFDKVDYYIHPFTKSKLKDLLAKMDIPASELLRKSDRLYKELDLKNKIYSDDEIIDLMVLHPDIIQRPIVEKGDKAVLGRPPEKIRTLLR
jgi:arsenate reductase (glutaredoxin)